jgi:hypothetical protein
MSEQFRQDMIKWLEHQDRDGDFCDEDAAAQGLRSLTVEDGVQIATTWAKDEVLEDVACGRVPVTVSSFSELHDYVDANGYGGAFEWPCTPSIAREIGTVSEAYVCEFTRFWNAVQGNVDAWIKAGGVHRGGEQMTQRTSSSVAVTAGPEPTPADFFSALAREVGRLTGEVAEAVPVEDDEHDLARLTVGRNNVNLILRVDRYPVAGRPRWWVKIGLACVVRGRKDLDVAVRQAAAEYLTVLALWRSFSAFRRSV